MAQQGADRRGRNGASTPRLAQSECVLPAHQRLPERAVGISEQRLAECLRAAGGIAESETKSVVIGYLLLVISVGKGLSVDVIGIRFRVANYIN